MFVIIIFAFFLQVNSDVTSVCNVCVCGFDAKSAGDFQGDIVDCSYKMDFIDQNYTIPSTIYSLDLSGNNLSRITATSIPQSLTMKVLFLNSNVLTKIEANSLILPNLKRLDLSNNLLEHIDRDIFKSIKKLEYLNLADNKFTTFTKLTFHPLSALQEMILDNNGIGPSLQDGNNLFDRSGYGLTHKIRSLSLSGIILNKVPDNFFIDAYDIRKLIMSNNSLSDIFELPFTLEYLDLSDNPIAEIEREDFNDVPAMKTLKLNNVAIKEVEESTFSPLKSLTHLELERNLNLTEFSPKAFGRDVVDDAEDFVLESLSLKNSRLTKLDSDLFRPLERLIHLDLQGNSWHCDCNLAWIKTLQIPDKDNFHLRCLTPKPLYNARIISLSDKYFTCAIAPQHTGLAIAVIALGSILAAVAVWFFVVVPKMYHRNNIIRDMYAPSTAYSVLPMTAAFRGNGDL